MEAASAISRLKQIARDSITMKAFPKLNFTCHYRQIKNPRIRFLAIHRGRQLTQDN
jgi:hypothetical protein